VSEEDRDQRVRKSLADARLVEIELDEFPERIRQVKQAAIARLGELLQTDANLGEPRSVAHSLGTLSRLENTLRAEGEPHAPQRTGSSESTETTREE
jgi:hypothetical protein